MSIFSPIYSRIGQQQPSEDNNNFFFDTKDLDSLKCLKLTNKSIANIIENFDSFKWKNNKYTNLLALDFCGGKNSSVNFLNSNVCCDSLYVNKNNNSDVKALYVTSHIIYYHYIDGYSTADILNKRIINIERLCAIPKFVFRSFENKSVEFMGNEEKFKNDRYVTLKSFYDYNNEKTFDLENIQFFLNSVYDVLIHHNLIPYFIHPQRLFLYDDNTIKLVSPNLLQFVFSPYFRYAKIQHSLFSHPIVLEHDFNKEKHHAKYAQRIITDNVDLFLDFFHSLFVTVLWIYNLNNNNIKEEIKSIKYLMRNEHSFFNNMTSVFIKNKSAKINKNPLLVNLLNNNNNNNNDNDNINPCKNIYGFCQNYYPNNELKNLIHNYGCLHLQVNMPIVLTNAMTQANDNNKPEIFFSSVRLEFEIFSNFINQIKNI